MNSILSSSTYTFFAILVLFTISSFVKSQSIGKCGPDESKKFDDSVSGVTIVGNVNGSFPSSMLDVNNWCATTKDSVKAMKDFSKKCLGHLSRQVANLIAYSVSKHQKRVCKNNKSKNEAASKLRCLNNNYDNLAKEMAVFVEDYQKTISLEHKKKLPGLCCSFHAFAERSKKEARKVCSNESSLYFTEFIKAISSDAIDLLCNRHTSESESCKKLVLPAKPNNMPPAKSFLPPLLMSLTTNI
jgi:hypothetical protein